MFLLRGRVMRPHVSNLRVKVPNRHHAQLTSTAVRGPFSFTAMQVRRRTKKMSPAKKKYAHAKRVEALKRLEAVGKIDDDERAISSFIGIHSRVRDFDIAYEHMLRLGRTSLPLYNFMANIVNTKNDAERLISHMPKRDADGMFFTTLLRSILGFKDGSVDDLDVLTKVLGDNGYTIPSNMVLTSMISEYANNGRVEKAKKLFNLIRFRKIRPDVILYSAMIVAAGIESIADAEKYLKEMLNDRVEPDVATYKALLHSYVRDSTEARHVLNLMRDVVYAKKGIDHACLTRVYLIKLYMRLGRQSDALKCAKEIHNKRMLPDTNGYNDILGVLAHFKQIERMRGTYQLMLTRGDMPNCYTYASLISACASVKMYSEAVAYYEDMVNMDIQADSVVYNCLFRMLRSQYAAGDPADVKPLNQAVEFVQIMKDKSVKLDVVTFTEVLTIHGLLGDSQAAQATLDEMNAAGIPPTVEHYTALMDILSKDFPHAALDTYYTMTKANIEPTTDTFYALIRTYITAGDMDGAMGIHNDMKRSDHSLPDTNSYFMLFKGFEKEKRYKEAFLLVEEMRKEQVRVSFEFQSHIDDLKAGSTLDQHQPFDTKTLDLDLDYVY